MNQPPGQTPTYPDFERIETLLTHLYTREELITLCHDTPALHPLYTALPPTHNDATFIRQLITTAHRTNHLNPLLATVQTHHPTPYTQHAPYRTTQPPPIAQEDLQPAPQPILPPSGGELEGGRDPSTANQVQDAEINAPTFDQRGQTVTTQTNVAGNATINQAPETGAALPNNRFWMWILGLGAILLVIAAPFAIVNDFLGARSQLFPPDTPTPTLTATATATPTPTPLPTATPLAFAPATDDETLIIIATFHGQDVARTEPHIKIKRAIIDKATTAQFAKLRVEVEPTILTADDRQEAEALGELFNASFIIWGEDTDIQVLVSMLNLKKSTQQTIDKPIINREDYVNFILDDLPNQVAFLAFLAVGQSLLEVGRDNEAREAIELAITEAKQSKVDDKTLAEAYNQLGWIYLERLDDANTALEKLEKAITLDETNGVAYYHRGVALWRSGQKEEALSDLNKAITLTPDYNWAYYNRGVIMSELGDYDGAIADLTSAINNIEPEYAWAYYSRADVYGKQGAFDDAIADVNKAIELQPQVPWFHYLQGDIYYQLGDYTQAQQSFTAAIDNDRDFSWAYYLRAVTSEQLSNFGQALIDYTTTISYASVQSINQESPLPWAHYQRGLIYADRGDIANAIDDFDQVIALNLHLDLVQQAQQRLTELKSQQEAP